MKAAVLFQKQDIRCVDMEEPCVKQGEVKVRIAAVGICGSDVPRYMEGRVHAFPLVLGHEFSGVVAEAGEGVSSVKPGDHVWVVGQLSMGWMAVLLAFIFPFLLVVVSLFLFMGIWEDELRAALCALLLLIPYYYILWLNRVRVGKKFSFTIQPME